LARELLLPEPQDDAEQKAVDDIRQFGWHCMLVRARVDEPEGPIWSDHAAVQAAYEATSSYTLGLSHSFDHAELILVGAWSGAQAILNRAGELIAGGEQFRRDAISRDVLEGYPVRFDAVDDRCRRELMTWTVWANFNRPFAALQVVLPDRKGRWPEDDAYGAIPQPRLAAQ
jgi:hypothetical protein